MEAQEAKPSETRGAGNGGNLLKNAEQREDEKLKIFLDEGKIAISQKNVAEKDLKAGKRFECLPYLYVGKELPIDLVLEASQDWYDEENPDVFNTAVLLLRCQNISIQKMQAARNYFDILPEGKELMRLVSAMDDAAFTAYLEEYRNSRDPVVLSRRIREMEECVVKIQESVHQGSAVIKKMGKLLESATPVQTEQSRTEGEGQQAVKQLKTRNEDEIPEFGEETLHQAFEVQKAGLQRIEKLHQSGQINDAQRNLARYHIMSGRSLDSLPYLKAGTVLTISMIEDVSACMEAGMDDELISSVLQQKNMTGAKWKIISEIYPNIPEKDELIRYIKEYETEESLREALVEYKNRNDIEWVRAQLREKEVQLQRIGSRNKEVEEELQRLKKNTPVEEKNQAGNMDEVVLPEETAGEEFDEEEIQGAFHEEGEAGMYDEDSFFDEGMDAGIAVENAPVFKMEEEKNIPFLERLFPGFYHAERKEVIRVRQRKKKERHEKEIRAEMKRTLEDLYAQDIIDEESFYIFAELAFKEQRMDEKAATFLVTEMRNGVPFSLLCKVIKNVKDSGDWTSAARVLSELIRYQEAMEMQSQPIPATM